MDWIQAALAVVPVAGTLKHARPCSNRFVSGTCSQAGASATCGLTSTGSLCPLRSLTSCEDGDRTLWRDATPARDDLVA